mgnify:CR=1 FL=1
MAVAARLNRAEKLGDRILKVDHAGEHGAVNIYRGQIHACRWRAPSLVAQLHDNRTHEEMHRNIFDLELTNRSVRRCRSYHLCGLGGYVLGLITGLIGPNAIAATTVAVERVVLGHLQEQLAALQGSDPMACETISSIIEDEQSHHDRAALQMQAGKLWSQILLPVVGGCTEVVIWLGMNL